VRLNCAAIPLDLLESELFGHEKGCVHRSHSQKIGRSKWLTTGRCFFDEVGDIPPRCNPNCLRVLQEQEFERLGSGRLTRERSTRAATNRDLEEWWHGMSSAAICTTVLMSSQSLCRPYATARMNTGTRETTLSTRSGRPNGKQIESIPPRQWQHSSHTPGPEIYVSYRT